jgi:membrane protein YdbS with pleckstrin-like domain
MAEPEAPALPEPSRPLSPKARWIWRLEWVAGCLAALFAAAVASGAISGGWELALWVAPALALVAGVPVVPELRWRRWRWEVREHEIDLRRGVLRERKTLIPMERVQHVETTRGVIEQILDLATVRIHTAAGSHTIPLLRVADAGGLRATIAELARTDAPAPAASNEHDAPAPAEPADHDG